MLFRQIEYMLVVVEEKNFYEADERYHALQSTFMERTASLPVALPASARKRPGH